MNENSFIDTAMNLNDPDWIMDHITIGLQRTSSERVIKKPCELDGLEQYLFLQDSFCSIKVIPVLLSANGIPEDAAWKRAMENLCTGTQIIRLEKVIADLSGVSCVPPIDSGLNLYIITNRQTCKGASAILNRKALRSFAQAHSTDMLFALPSSIHEMIIAPYDDSFSLDELSAMVSEINETQVAPDERLTDRAYIIRP